MHSFSVSFMHQCFPHVHPKITVLQKEACILAYLGHY